jgi:hypothetical protein
MRGKPKSPLSAVAQGFAAGVVGTAVFTAYQSLTSGSNGSGDRPQRWDDAPEPAQVGHRVAAGVFHRDIPLRHVGLVTTIVHWAYGSWWGVVYGLIEESVEQPLLSGVALTTTVMAADYTLLPAMKLYDPPWAYPPRTLAKDYGTHLVHGLAVAGAYAALERIRRRRR